MPTPHPCAASQPRGTSRQALLEPPRDDGAVPHATAADTTDALAGLVQLLALSACRRRAAAHVPAAADAGADTSSADTAAADTAAAAEAAAADSGAADADADEGGAARGGGRKACMTPGCMLPRHHLGNCEADTAGDAEAARPKAKAKAPRSLLLARRDDEDAEARAATSGRMYGELVAETRVVEDAQRCGAGHATRLEPPSLPPSSPSILAPPPPRRPARARHAHLEYVGALRRICRLEAHRSAHNHKRTFNHYAERQLGLDDATITELLALPA